MGFVSGIADKIRGFWSKDKEQAANQLATGSTSNATVQDQRDILLGLGASGFLNDRFMVERDLATRYAEYEEMDDYPEIATAIDIFADDTSQPDTQLNRVIWIESKDKEVLDILDDGLLQQNLRIDEDVWEISRTLCKYGSDYEEMLVSEQGVIGLNFLPAPTIRRVEDARGTLLGFIQDFKEDFKIDAVAFQKLIEVKRRSLEDYHRLVGDQTSQYFNVAVFEPWEVIHFRLRSKFRRSVYGYSVLEPARWIWKRLTLLEDASILFRLTKAVERYAFYVDVGDMPPQEAYAYVNKVRQSYKKKKYVNPTTNKLELKFDPLSQDDDIWVPSRGGQDGTRIDVLGGPQWQHMDDIEYFREKLLCAIKVPKAYLGAEEGAARAILSNEDVRFARSILRVQRALKNGIHKICRTHLAALGIDPYSVQFEIRMTVPSAIFELAQLEVRNARADLAARSNDFFNLEWILVNIFHISPAEAKVIHDKKLDDNITNAVTAGKGEAEAQRMMMAVQAGGEEGGEEQESVEKLPRNPAEAKRYFNLRALHERNEKRARDLRNRSANSSGNGNGHTSGLDTSEATKKLQALLKNDRSLMRRIESVAGLLKDLHLTVEQAESHRRSQRSRTSG